MARDRKVDDGERASDAGNSDPTADVDRDGGAGGASVGDPSVASLPGFDDAGGPADPSVARLPEDGGAETVAVQRSTSMTDLVLGSDDPEGEIDPEKWEDVTGIDREDLEEMDDEEVIAVAMTMMEEDEAVVEMFGQRLDLFGQDRLSAGDYFYEMFEGAASGALMDAKMGSPGVMTAIGALSAPFKAEAKHQISSNLEKDYAEYAGTGKIDLFKHLYSVVVEGDEEFAARFEGEYITERQEGREEAGLGDFDSEADGQGMDPETVQKRVEKLKDIDTREWKKKMTREERREHLAALQEAGLMSSTLFGTMSQVDEGTLGSVEWMESIKEGGIAGGISSMLGAAKRIPEAVMEGVDPVEAGTEIGTKGLLKTGSTALVDLLTDAAGIETDIREGGDEFVEKLRELLAEGDVSDLFDRAG